MQAFSNHKAHSANKQKSLHATVLRGAGATLLAGAMLLQPLSSTAATTAKISMARHNVSQALPAAGAPLASQYFSPTGKSVRGAFLSAFNRYSLAQIGYPLSDERVENGHTVQYFERVRMEAHPELNSQGFPVLMSRLGADMTQGVQFQKVAPFASTPTRAYTANTGHSIGGGFYQYWRQNGGVQLFGYPISEEFAQDGYTVQWFERARFEYHPELARTGTAIQLSRLGSAAYSTMADRTGAQAPAQQAPQAPAPAAPVAPAPAAPVTAAPVAEKVAFVQSVSLSSMESYVLQSVNDQRAAAGLAPVKLDAAVTDIARSRSNDMAARNYFSHTTPEGNQFFGMLADHKIAYKYGGEILARNNYPDDQAAQVAVDSYLNSAPHKAIMLDSRYNMVGVGHAVDADGMHYFTVIFIQQ